MRQAARGIVILIIAAITACANVPRGVEWRADQSCQMLFVDAKSYSVTLEGLPGFIEPLISYAAHQSLQKKGLALATNDEPADLQAHLKFELVSLNKTDTRNDLDEVWMPGLVSRFNALVWVEVMNRRQEVIWSGVVNRSHAIMGDETFHTDRAAIFLQLAFDSLFENLLTPCSEIH